MTRLGLVAAVAALLAASVVAAGPVLATARPAGGASPCGRFRTVASPSTDTCTHGGDPAPPGVNLHDRATRMRTWAKPGAPATSSAPGSTSALATSSGSTQAAAVAAGGAVPCIGDGVSGDRVQAVYAHPAGTDNYAQFLASFRSWAADVDRNVAVSAAQTGGVRHVRWVTDSSCQLSVADVTLSATSLNSSDPSVWGAELASQGFNQSSRKYLVWADADALCGIATFYTDEQPGLANNNNGTAGSTYARVDRGCWGGVAAGLDRSVETHELGHMLGAVLADAPHHTQSGHCYDGADVMCQQQGSDPPTLSICPALQQSLYDCNHDDYFSTNPSPASYLGTHWDTANSSFLSSTPAPTSALPTIAAATPALAAAGAAATVTVAGTNFRPGALVQLEQAGLPSIQLPSVQVAPGLLTGTVNIPAGASGVWNVRVINVDDASTATLANVLTIGTLSGAPTSPPTTTPTTPTTQPTTPTTTPSGTAPVSRPAPGTAFVFDAYGGFNGGATVAVGNLVPSRTGDEVVTGAGPGGGPHVQVFSIDPTTGAASVVASFFPYDPRFTGGVRVAVGELDGDPSDGLELVTAPGAGGGPDVEVWKVHADGSVTRLYGFMAYSPAFTGGVTVAAGDLDPNHAGDEIVTGTGAGGGPHVRVWDGTDGSSGFFAYSPAFTGGVNVAVGNFGNYGHLIITGAGPGGGPDVEAFTAGGGRIGGFMAYSPAFTGGVSVAAGNVDGNPGDEIITGAGPGGGAEVRAFSTSPIAGYFAYPSFTGGVQVAAGDTNGDGVDEIVTVPWTGGPVQVVGQRV